MSADEKRVAICSLQLMLLRAGFNPGPIDGIYGGDTREQHERFAAQFGFGVTDPRVAENLINAMHPKEE
jgi:peptidoglycan hydrolase-like protein with peptidoglycan-binding domain